MNGCRKCGCEAGVHDDEPYGCWYCEDCEGWSSCDCDTDELLCGLSFVGKYIFGTGSRGDFCERCGHTQPCHLDTEV
jgi:hypothetical protein